VAPKTTQRMVPPLSAQIPMVGYTPQYPGSGLDHPDEYVTSCSPAE
jgi:hypothetical protein